MLRDACGVFIVSQCKWSIQMNAVSAAGSIQQSSISELLKGQRSGGGNAPPPPPPSEEAFASVGESLGLGASEVASLRGEIESAVKDALSRFDGSGSRKDAVSSAVNSVLEANGIDPQAFKSAMEKLRGSDGARAPRPNVAQSQQPSDQLFFDSSENESSSLVGSFRSLPTGSLINISA